LGPNGAGKTTTFGSCSGIIDPSSGTRHILGHERPMRAAPQVGYLPEERGLYPAMHCRDAIAFMGALRGLSLGEGRRRADALLTSMVWATGRASRSGLCRKAWRRRCNCSARSSTSRASSSSTSRFPGSTRSTRRGSRSLIRRQARSGVTIIFSTHVIAHAERLCERIAIIARGRVVFEGAVDEARATLRPIVRLRTRNEGGEWRKAIPDSARREGRNWVFELPESGPEPLLKALIDGGAGIETLAIERTGPSRCLRRDRRRRGGRGDGRGEPRQ
jgi:ABC-2 type transport system ATP-binding protein